jgi:hypothetical protein
MWLTNEEHYKVVKDAWTGHSNNITVSLSHTLSKLHNWGKEKFGCITKKIQQARKDLQLLTDQNINDPMLAIKEKEKELDNLLQCEEMWWSQRSRALWLKHGDKTPPFFIKKLTREGEEIKLIKYVTPKALPTMTLSILKPPSPNIFKIFLILKIPCTWIGLLRWLKIP